MLEVRNLIKNYETTGKHPVYVRALNGISLKFPDTGLIFILGKSGSGKSTLLNVMGGLDSVDSGEIIIKGKSSANFKSSDFDSYRNTYLGFIFQEYNILDEFTVAKNISLALELQGKKHKKADIDEILKEVDLEGLNDRKPNELSGGQKQRVAIARALVKHPDIIFADEPTGALDSTTGKAVFDTLKKLSKNHLVVVVSHDRDFAETFGDRVIELKDGKVISDIEKQVVGSILNSGLNIIDDKLIQIKKGYKLTEEDKKKLLETIDKNDDEKIIVMDEEISPQVKKISNISDLGNKERFEKTDENKIKNKTEKFKLIKSKLGVRNCFKIGASALKVKPFRLFLTMFLALLCFSALGLVDSMTNFNKVVATTDSIIDSNYEYLSFKKSVVQKNGSDYNSRKELFSDEELLDFNKNFGCDFKGKAKAQDLSMNFYENRLLKDNIPDFYQRTDNETTYKISDEILKDNNFKIISGDLPDEDYEVAITDYQLQVLNKTGYVKNKGQTITIEAGKVNKENIIGKTLGMDSPNFTICGVVDTGFMANSKLQNNFSVLKEVTHSSKEDYYKVLSNFESLLQNSMINTYLLDENFYDKICVSITYANSGLIKGTGNCYDYGTKNGNQIMRMYPSSYPGIKIKYYGKRTSLTANEEICVPFRFLIEHFSRNYSEYNSDLSSIKLNSDDNDVCALYNNDKESFEYSLFDLYSNNELAICVLGNRHKEEIIKNGFNVKYINTVLNEEKYIGGGDGNFLDDKSFLQAYVDNCKNFPKEFSGNSFINEIYYYDLLNNYGSFIYVLFEYSHQDITVPVFNVTIEANASSSDSKLNPNYVSKRSIGGIVMPITGNSDLDPYAIADNDELKSILNSSLYDITSIPKYFFIMTKVPKNRDLITKLVQYHYDNKEKREKYEKSDARDSVAFSILNGIIFETIDFINNTFSMLNKLFFYCGLILALFTCLLLFNVISTSISYKKREIGILRAVGARGKDVFGIFFSESMIIVLIDIFLSVVTTIGVCMFLNSYFKQIIGVPITLLHIGLRQVLVIAVIGFVVAFISTFIPVYKTSNKKPIDAIRDK